MTFCYLTPCRPDVSYLWESFLTFLWCFYTDYVMSNKCGFISFSITCITFIYFIFLKYLLGFYLLFIEQNRIPGLLIAEKLILTYFVFCNNISIGQTNVFGGENMCMHMCLCRWMLLFRHMWRPEIDITVSSSMLS